jgi:hypothetical protein
MNKFVLVCFLIAVISALITIKITNYRNEKQCFMCAEIWKKQRDKT